MNNNILWVLTLMLLLFSNTAESGVSVKFYTEADCDNIRVTLGGHLNQYTLNCGKWIGFDVNTPGVWPTVVEGCGGRYELYVETWRDVEIIICPHHLNITDCCSRGVDPLGQFHCNECPEPECKKDIDCDDGLFCNGAETCEYEECQTGTSPCPDDGVFCNGWENCDEVDDICLHSGNPCEDDGLYCNGEESCDEKNDECIHSGDLCNEGELCDEENDKCLPPPVPCSIIIEPETAEVVSKESLAFTIETAGDCSDSDYEWSVDSNIGSEIDQSGNYVADINFNMFDPATDVVKVVAHANDGITAEATVTVLFGCPSMQIYGENSEEVAALRKFREGVLSETPEGQELIRLYYQWSPVIIKAMEEDEEFKEEVKEMVDGVLSMIRTGDE